MDGDLKFSVGGHDYSVGRLDAKRQFHIVRRMLPLFSGILDALKGGGVESVTDAAAIKGLIDASGSIPDDQLDYVIDNCLAVVERADGATWAKITTALPSGGRDLMYKDIDLVAMMTIVFYVLKRNLSGFFDALPSESRDKIKEALNM